MELLKLLSTSEVVAQVINFILLLVFLRIFFWKKVLKVMDERKERIASEFKNIEDTKKEVEKLKSDYDAKLSFIGEIAKGKIQEAQEEAQKVAEGIKKEANLEAQKIIDTTKVEMRYEIAKAKEELKSQIVDLAIRSAENLIGERLTGEGDKRLVEEFIKEIDKKG